MSRFIDLSIKCGLGGALAASMCVPFDSAIAKKSETVLHAFAGGSDGAAPYTILIADQSGNLYGTTRVGGTANVGTVFKVAPDGTETVLYSFLGGNDGAYPQGGLILDTSGNLYGTTSQGGGTIIGEDCRGPGCGTVFKLAPDGMETILYSFHGQDYGDGYSPLAGVIMDKKGNIYGTTELGGVDNYGTVFKLSPKGKEKLLYTFTDGSDGASPYASLIMDKSGNLYGTVGYGGSGFHNAGAVFKIAPNGSETTLYTFTDGTDGANPFGTLTTDKAGNLYGTTSSGGAANDGTVFKLAPDGTETTLYAFQGGSDGSHSYSDLVMDKAGNLYGTTYGGGSADDGTVFKLAPSGTETVLHAFAGGSDGASPQQDGLLLDASGNLYGATPFGGSTDCGGNGCGTVFKLHK